MGYIILTSIYTSINKHAISAQYGFCETSCKSQINTIYNFATALNNGHKDAIFLDMPNKAFDTIPHTKLSQNSPIIWFATVPLIGSMSFLANRTRRLILNGHSYHQCLSGSVRVQYYFCAQYIIIKNQAVYMPTMHSYTESYIPLLIIKMS